MHGEMYGFPPRAQDPGTGPGARRGESGKGGVEGGELGAGPPDPSPPEPGGVTPGPRRSDQEEEWGGEGIGEGLVPPDFRAQGSKICEERALGEGLGEGMLG